MRIARTIATLILGLSCAGGLSPGAQAETLTWLVKNEHRYRLQISFYSQNRNVSWPGGGRAWDIVDYKEHRYVLECNRGEKICCGAWTIASDYWGVGQNNQYGCSKCGYVYHDQQFPRAIADIDRAQELDPRSMNWRWHYVRADSCQRIGNRECAAADYKRMWESAPERFERDAVKARFERLGGEMWEEAHGGHDPAFRNHRNIDWTERIRGNGHPVYGSFNHGDVYS